MNESVTYKVSPELQKASMQAYFRHITLGKKWIGLAGFLTAGVLCFISDSVPYRIYFGIGFCTIGFALSILWLKSYHIHLKIADDYLNLHENRTVTVMLTDRDITLERPGSYQQIEWSRISRFVDAGDFLILMSGTVPAANLPKSFFNKKQIDFICSHAESAADT